MDIKSKIRVIEDFPQKGISFKDITTLIKDAETFEKTVDLLIEAAKDYEFDYIVGIEARGFIFAAPMAVKMEKGFIPIRKPGKLPGNILVKEYDLEYGTNKIELDADVLKKGDKVLLFDDLLATGGTAKAALELIEETGAEVTAVGFLIELTDLNGKDCFKNYNHFSLVKYNH